MRLRELSVLACALPLFPSTGRAECFVQTGQFVMAQRSVQLVFSGTVIGITPVAPYDRYRITFTVDRVWKGSVPKQFDLYVSQLDEGMRGFQMGQWSVVTATRLTDRRARQEFGLGGTSKAAFKAPICSDTLAPDIHAELGPGYPPK